jgi:uncharacterized protein YpiB (UPF0302 family)
MNTNTTQKKFKLMKHNNKVASVSYTLSQEQEYLMKLCAQLILDELCYTFNKKRLETLINDSIDSNDKEMFRKLSSKYNRLLQANS